MTLIYIAVAETSGIKMLVFKVQGNADGKQFNTGACAWFTRV